MIRDLIRSIRDIHITFRLKSNRVNFPLEICILTSNVNKICKDHQILKCVSLKCSMLFSLFYVVQKTSTDVISPEF